MLSMVHVAHRTPAPAIIVQVAMILILIIPGDFDTLINMLSFTEWLFYGLCAAAVLILRRKYPELHRPYRVGLPTCTDTVHGIKLYYMRDILMSGEGKNWYVGMARYP